MSDCKDWEWTVGGFPCGDVGGKMLIGDLNNRMSHINNEHISMDNQTKSEYVDLDWKSQGRSTDFPICIIPAPIKKRTGLRYLEQTELLRLSTSTILRSIIFF